MKFLKNCKFIFLLLLLALLASCSSEEMTTPSATSDAAVATAIPTVKVAALSPRAFEGELKITGVLAPNRSVSVHAMASGFISSIRKDIGQRVRKGETIALLKNPELELELQEAEVEVEANRKPYERYKAIYDKTPELTNVFDLEKMEAALLRSQSKIKTIKARQAMLRVTAPFGGIVTMRHLDEGALVQSGIANTGASPIIDIMEISKLRLVIEVPESEMSLIKEGTKLDIDFPEFPGKSMQATVSRMAYALDAQTKTMHVECDIPNRDLSLKPGMYAKISLKLKRSKDAPALPIMALISVKGKQFVYKMNGDRVEKVPIKLGLEDQTHAEVTEGLKVGDKVVVEGKALVSDGAQVIAIGN